MPKLARTAFVSSDTVATDVLQLIADYQRAARAAVAALVRETRASNPLAAWRRGRTSRTGRLKSPRGNFAFHGTGCRFEIAGRAVDVDFGPSGRHDGFDAWRLAQYAESAFEWASLKPARIAGALSELEAAGLIYKPGWEPTRDLYYLREHAGRRTTHSRAPLRREAV